MPFVLELATPNVPMAEGDDEEAEELDENELDANEEDHGGTAEN